MRSDHEHNLFQSLASNGKREMKPDDDWKEMAREKALDSPNLGCRKEVNSMPCCPCAASQEFILLFYQQERFGDIIFFKEFIKGRIESKPQTLLKKEKKLKRLWVSIRSLMIIPKKMMEIVTVKRLRLTFFLLFIKVSFLFSLLVTISRSSVLSPSFFISFSFAVTL